MVDRKQVIRELEYLRSYGRTIQDPLVYEPVESAIIMLRSQEWIRVEDRLPKDQETVLAVKQLKSGERSICLAYCIAKYEHYDPVTGETTVGPYWVCGGNNNIIRWMPLPEMPT